MTSSLLGSIFRLTLFHLDHLDNQHNPAQSNTAQDGPVQPSRAQFRPVELSTSQDGPVQPNTAQKSPVHPSIAQYSPMGLRTVQYSPVQLSAAQLQPSTRYSLQSSLTSSHLSPYLPFQKPHSLVCLVVINFEDPPPHPLWTAPC